MKLFFTHKGQLLAAIVFSILLRIAHICYYLPYRDSINYIQAAENVKVNPFWDSFTTMFAPNMPPLLHLYLGGIVLLNGSAFFWGLVLMLFADILMVLGVYLCSKKLFSDTKNAGIIAAWLIAGTPKFVEVGSNIMRDNLYFCCIAFAVYFGMSLVRKKNHWRMAFGYGLCCAVGFLFRKEGLELLLIFFIWSAFAFFRYKGEKITVARNCIVVARTFCLIVLPIYCLLLHYYPVGLGAFPKF